MQLSDMKVFRTLGQIQSFISKVSSFDEAIRGEARIVVDNGVADHVIVWCGDRGTDTGFAPYYWICPVDMTTRICPPDTGIVGRACSGQKPEECLDFEKDADPGDKAILAGMAVSSAVCVPFSIDGGPEGCMQFIRTAPNAPFTDDEAKTCGIIAMFGEMYITEAVRVPAPKKQGKPILSAAEIRKNYISGGTSTEVLKGVNVEVFDGEMLCIQGESGCGKSTFLNILGGLLNADGGTLTFMGNDLTAMSRDELTLYRRRNIGFVFQSYNLMPNLTAAQNLDLIAELVDDPMDTREALELVGLGDKANNYPSQLSGGQQQRVSIARAIVKRPKLIFADEPTAALDYHTAIEVLTVFERIKQMGTSILMVTHNEEITRMADRVIRLRDGKTYEMNINHRPVGAMDLRW